MEAAQSDLRRSVFEKASQRVDMKPRLLYIKKVLLMI